MGTAAQTERNRKIWDSILADLPVAERQGIQSVINHGDLPPFCDFIVDTFDKDARHGKAGALSFLLLNSEVAVRAICNPKLCSLSDAIRLAHSARRLDDRLDCNILKYASRPARGWPDQVPEPEILRVLDVIDAISDCQRLMLFLLPLSKMPYPRTRSKVVKLMARARRNPAWAERIFEEADPRVRANLVEGVAARTSRDDETLFHVASQDRHHRVVVNALLALCQRGDEPSCDKIRKLAADPDPLFRQAAEWALRRLDRKK